MFPSFSPSLYIAPLPCLLTGYKFLRGSFFRLLCVSGYFISFPADSDYLQEPAGTIFLLISNDFSPNHLLTNVVPNSGFLPTFSQSIGRNRDISGRNGEMVGSCMGDGWENAAGRPFYSYVIFFFTFPLQFSLYGCY